ncbi:hypothetical protein [Brevibacillus brevis]|uniref:hypothetical protein n=1 Tax=Brevibacillus brevis TaxID=1393 RepID=UPI000D113216|nr:hypothetical protein [Brevibacillus brevis]PSJ58660.1 hypothetical protein C7J99_32005 [Brevibacillus brevis]RED20870.1 hypothetical protein DES34_1318 [Brevibacillus brevis]GEC93755.1 hypothetical protein BBR01nite_60860 [Brevibacillus brevis]VEF87249.1 Uncharacterised protein [Brevibacillus brevis]
MQAGRELDKQVAVGLGWEVDEHIDIYLKEGAWREIPHFSTKWEGMGVLVEEAIKKQDVYLKFEADPHGWYEAGAWDEREWRNYGPIASDSAPYAMCIVFLKAMRIAI